MYYLYIARHWEETYTLRYAEVLFLIRCTKTIQQQLQIMMENYGRDEFHIGICLRSQNPKLRPLKYFTN